MRKEENGEFALFGFYTTRWVEADSPEAAETEALALLRSEETFAFPEGYSGALNAAVFFDEIVEVEGPQRQGGATWFPMEEPPQG